MKLIAIKIASFAWEHGERLLKAPIALTIVLSIMSLFLAVYRFPGTSETSLSVFFVLTWSALLYHVDLFLAVPTRSVIRGLLLFDRSGVHSSELKSLMRFSYSVFCLKQS